MAHLRENSPARCFLLSTNRAMPGKNNARHGVPKTSGKQKNNRLPHSRRLSDSGTGGKSRGINCF